MTGVPNIAIIGGGASGTLTCVQLMAKLHLPANVYLIEGTGSNLFRGAAYSSTLEYEPLNVPAGKMSAFNHLPDDFLRWLRYHRDASAHRESYVSRRWFGNYLKQLYDKFAAKTITTPSIINATVINIETEENKYYLELSNQQLLHADYIIFCTGNEAPASILHANEQQSISSYYKHNPWVNCLEGLTGDEHILILGTGLTAVDYLGSLYNRRHVGKIYCFSRNGYLPLMHADEVPYVLDEYPEGKSLYEIYRLITRNITIAKEKNLPWQAVMDALRPRVSRIWKGLNLEDRALFMRRVKWVWEIHRHRMPPNSAKMIAQMQHDGQLEIISGRYLKAEEVPPFAKFTYQCKKSGALRELLLNRIINCTGPENNYLKGQNELIKSLLKKKWMITDPLLLGIETGTRGEIMRAGGVVMKNWYSVGPIRKACEWESTAIREIRTQAENVAELIADSIHVKTDVLTEI